jgi:hypothetical protein
MMNEKHAKAILEKILEWYASGETAPQAGALVFDDDFTFKEHVQAALAGAPLDITQDPFYRAGGGPAKEVLSKH